MVGSLHSGVLLFPHICGVAILGGYVESGRRNQQALTFRELPARTPQDMRAGSGTFTHPNFDKIITKWVTIKDPEKIPGHLDRVFAQSFGPELTGGVLGSISQFCVSLFLELRI